jgi:hypothetical protein
MDLASTGDATAPPSCLIMLIDLSMSPTFPDANYLFDVDGVLHSDADIAAEHTIFPHHVFASGLRAREAI